MRGHYWVVLNLRDLKKNARSDPFVTFKNLLVEIVFSLDILSVLQPEPGAATAGQPEQVTPGQDLHHHPGRLQGELLLDGHQLGRGVLRYVLLLGPGLESLYCIFSGKKHLFCLGAESLVCQKNGKIFL